jgi:hypothetical protein
MRSTIEFYERKQSMYYSVNVFFILFLILIIRWDFIFEDYYPTVEEVVRSLYTFLVERVNGFEDASSTDCKFLSILDSPSVVV